MKCGDSRDGTEGQRTGAGRIHAFLTRPGMNMGTSR